MINKVAFGREMSNKYLKMSDSKKNRTGEVQKESYGKTVDSSDLLKAYYLNNSKDSKANEQKKAQEIFNKLNSSEFLEKSKKENYQNLEYKEIVKDFQNPKVLKSVMQLLKQDLYKQADKVRTQYPKEEALEKLRDIEVQKATINYYIKNAEKNPDGIDKKSNPRLLNNISFKGRSYFEKLKIGRPWHGEVAFDQHMNEKVLTDEGKQDQYIDFIARKTGKSKEDVHKSIAPELIEVPPLSKLIENQRSILHFDAIKKRNDEISRIDIQSENSSNDVMKVMRLLEEKNNVENKYKKNIKNANIVFRLKQLLMNKKCSEAEIVGVAQNEQTLFGAFDNEDKGDEYLQKNNLGMALNNYEVAISNRQDFLKKYQQEILEDSYLGDLLHKTGDVLIRSNEFEKADELFSDSLKIRENLDSDDKFQSYLKLGETNYLLGKKAQNDNNVQESNKRFNNSILYLKNILDSKKLECEEKDEAIEKYKTMCPKLVSTKDFNMTLAKYYINELEPEKAIENYKLALKKTEKASGKESLEAANLHKLIADAHEENDDFFRSALHNEKRVNILEKKNQSSVDENRELIRSWLKATDSYIKDKESSEAIKCLDHAQKLFSMKPVSDFDKINILQMLALRHKQLGNNDKALEEYLTALGISDKINGTDSGKSITLRRKIAELQNKDQT